MKITMIDSCCNNHQELVFWTYACSDTSQYSIYEPRFHTHANDVSRFGCVSIVCRGIDSHCLEFLQYFSRCVGHCNLFLLEGFSLKQSFYGGATHGTGA